MPTWTLPSASCATWWPIRTCLDVVPRRRQELHHALRADVRDDVVVVARLHPGERAREAAVDAVVRRPAVERVAHRSRVRRRHRRRRGDALRRGHAQLDADQERLRRVELVELRDLAERRSVLLRDRRQRVARPHDVTRQQRCRLHLLHRHARLQARAPRTSPARRRRPRASASRAGSACTPATVGVSMYAFTGTRTPCFTSRNWSTATSQPNLPRASVREPKSGVPSGPSSRRVLQVRDAGDVQAVPALERTHGGDRLRPDDRVDRPEVEALRAQRDLEARVLGIQGGARGRGCRHKPPRAPPQVRVGSAWTHGLPRRMRDSFPSHSPICLLGSGTSSANRSLYEPPPDDSPRSSSPTSDARRCRVGFGCDAAEEATVPTLIFPVAGAATYIDDFGQARAGGPHQGNDLMAAKKTPVVAVESRQGQVLDDVRERGLHALSLRRQRDDVPVHPSEQRPDDAQRQPRQVRARRVVCARPEGRREGVRPGR